MMIEVAAFITTMNFLDCAEISAAARAFAVITFDHREERRGLRDSHDRLKGQRGAVGVVAVGDPADRMAEDLD